MIRKIISYYGHLQDDYMTSMKSNITPTRTLKKESCVICFDDIDHDLMLSVGKCGHRFCSNCLKHHIEVMLLDGKLPTCPQFRCKSQLPIDRYDKLLTLKLRLMWKQNSISLRDRFYCPYKKCSYLMSKTVLLSSSSSVDSGLRRCLQCGGSFCLNCEVPWHNAQSCKDYKKLHRNLENDDDDLKLKSLAKLKGWLQCSMCKYMVERSYGCNYMLCRCGNRFCYMCGDKWNHKFHKNCYENRYGAAFSVVIYGIGISVVVIMHLFSNGPNRREISETVQKREINTDQDFSSFLFAFL